MLTNVTDSETSFARTEVLQGSSPTREPSDILPGISSASNPEQSSGAEVVINVNEAAASFYNDLHGSQLRLFGHQTSIVEREIDKIFIWQSKRLPFIDRTRQSGVLVHRSGQVTSTERRHVRFLRKVNDLIQNMRASKYCLLMKFILLAASISACCMGAKYEHDCPASDVTPFRLKLIGGFGIVLILFRITAAFKNKLSRLAMKMVEYVSMLLYCCLGIALCIEMIPFHNFCPDFENSFAPNYCQKTFYYYTFYMNIAAVVIGFVVFLMHFPCFKKMNEISYNRMA